MRLKAPALCLAALAAAWLTLPHAAAQTPPAARAAAPAFRLTAEDLKDGAAELDDAGWSYRFGDDPAWAARDYDDSAWATRGFVAAALAPEKSPPGERWEGRAWFRLRLDVDDELAGRPLVLRLGHWGASEVYVDGLFRGASGEVEEVTLKGAPLGSFPSYAYREREFELAPGDCLLLMSDGLPEMFNGRGEMFEEARARRAFAEVAREDAGAVVAHLAGACGAWAGGHPLEDDVTFLVLKFGGGGDGRRSLKT